MKLKNIELQPLLTSLVELAALKTGFKVANATVKSIRKLEECIKDIDKARLNIIEANCLKENNKPKIEKEEYLFESEEQKKKVTEEIGNLFELEIDIDIHSLPSKDFEDIKDITPALVYRLGKFIE
jgi:hypothetical protein